MEVTIGCQAAGAAAAVWRVPGFVGRDAWSVKHKRSTRRSDAAGGRDSTRGGPCIHVRSPGGCAKQQRLIFLPLFLQTASALPLATPEHAMCSLQAAARRPGGRPLVGFTMPTYGGTSNNGP